MPNAQTTPSHPSTATIKELAIAYKQARALKEQQADLLAKLKDLPPRTKNKAELVEQAIVVNTSLHNDFYECKKLFKMEFVKDYCNNAERFKKALPTSTLISDSNKELCNKVLEAIKNSQNVICKSSVMKNGVWFFVDIHTHFDGSVSKVCLYTEETKHNGLLTAYGNFMHYVTGEPINQYEVKAWSMTFKTPAELKEFAVACDFMDTLLECLQKADFVSTQTQAFDEALQAKIEELTKDEESEASE